MAQQNRETQPLESISQDVLSPLQLENEAHAEELDDEGEAESAEEDDDMDLFRSLLETLKLDMLADLAVRNRQSRESPDAFTPTAQVNLRGENRSKLSCEVISPPILGAYNAVLHPSIFGWCQMDCPHSWEGDSSIFVLNSRCSEDGY